MAARRRAGSASSAKPEARSRPRGAGPRRTAAVVVGPGHLGLEEGVDARPGRRTTSGGRSVVSASSGKATSCGAVGRRRRAAGRAGARRPGPASRTGPPVPSGPRPPRSSRLTRRSRRRRRRRPGAAARRAARWRRPRGRRRAVCSAGLWLMPPTLGAKTMPAGHTRASIWASWPAPRGACAGWTEPWPAATSLDQVDHRRRRTSTGAKRARRRQADRHPLGRRPARRTRSASRRSASSSTSSSVWRRSTVSVARAATTLTRSGAARCGPRCPPGRAVASASSRTATGDRPRPRSPASWRSRIGVVPAWLDWPVTLELRPRDALHAGDHADGRRASASSTGPCSMCSSTKACGGRAGHGMRARRSRCGPARRPARRRRWPPCRGPPRAARPPANTRLPSMSGAKREPSSLVKNATASGWVGLDAGGDHRLDDLEPGQHAEVAVVAAAGGDGVDVGRRVMTGGSKRSAGQVPTTLPISSTSTRRPRSRIHDTTRSRPGAVGVGQRQPAARRRRRWRRSRPGRRAGPAAGSGRSRTRRRPRSRRRSSPRPGRCRRAAPGRGAGPGRWRRGWRRPPPRRRDGGRLAHALGPERGAGLGLLDHRRHPQRRAGRARSG